MSNSNLFGDQISPVVFRETRVLPANISARLIGGVLDEISLYKSIRTVLDVGCGCGRMLEGFSRNSASPKITGIDISSTMLSAIPKQLQKSNNVDLMSGDCRKRNIFPSSSFDIVIVHWILNTTVGWESIIENAIFWAGPSGILLWFEEDSSLYDAVDGNALRTPGHTWTPFGIEMWRRWYMSLRENGRSEFLSERYGLPMKSQQREQILESAGYRIIKLTSAKQTWSKSIDTAWIVDKILKKRSFSNFWKVSDERYNNAVEDVISFVSRYANTPILADRLLFQSTPVIAIPCATSVSEIEIKGNSLIYRDTNADACLQPIMV